MGSELREGLRFGDSLLLLGPGQGRLRVLLEEFFTVPFRVLEVWPRVFRVVGRVQDLWRVRFGGLAVCDMFYGLFFVRSPSRETAWGPYRVSYYRLLVLRQGRHLRM